MTSIAPNLMVFFVLALILGSISMACLLFIPRLRVWPWALIFFTGFLFGTAGVIGTAVLSR